MLHTQYRPKSWNEFVGNERAVATARGALAIQAKKITEGIAKDGLAFQIVGLSGAGKTTMAMLLADEAGANGMDYMELDGV